jgi:hypothetical protein
MGGSSSSLVSTREISGMIWISTARAAAYTGLKKSGNARLSYRACEKASLRRGQSSHLKKCVTAASHTTLFVLFNRYMACHSMLAAMSNGCVDGKNIPCSTESLYLRLYVGQYLRPYAKGLNLSSSIPLIPLSRIYAVSNPASQIKKDTLIHIPTSAMAS